MTMQNRFDEVNFLFVVAFVCGKKRKENGYCFLFQCVARQAKYDGACFRHA